MHIYTLCPSLLQSFRQFCGAVSKELRWQTVLNSMFHFGQFFKFKKGVTRRKKLNQNFLWYAHLHGMPITTTKFHEILLSGFRGVALTNCFSSIFHFGQISKFKTGVTPRNELNQNFLWICASIHYVFHHYKVSWNSVERFQRSCADKKNRTNGLTDRLTDGSKTLYPPQLVAWGIMMVHMTILPYVFFVNILYACT